jgi:ubiquinone/menaquinone biosynthesis C-methylase UbiE
MKQLISYLPYKLARLFFRLLYHSFAWSYDFVAGMVSLGRWRTWVSASLPYLQGERVLELGHGPGHLQSDLLRNGIWAAGVDESRQMGRLAKHDNRRLRLVRAVGQALPFADLSFDTLVSTFPTRYILDQRTLSETLRVLQPGGRLIVTFSAEITGGTLPERFLAWLFHVTGQSGDPIDSLTAPFVEAGYTAEPFTVDLGTSRVFLILAKKPTVQ